MDETNFNVNMSDSILLTIKKMLDVYPEDVSFNLDIIVNINTSMSILYQLGIGTEAFKITSESETWTDYLGPISNNLEMVKNYIFARAKSIFDAPTSSALSQALKEDKDELAWRINVEVDT